MADKVTLLPPVGGSMQVGSVAEPITTVYCQHIHHSDGSTATEILTLAGAHIDANGHLVLTLHGGGTLDVGTAKGDTGATPVLSIGTVTTGNPGTQAQVTISGTNEEPVLNLVIPEGDTGATPQLSVGTVTTGNPGTEAQVTITGTAESPVLNMTIPKGTTGDTGAGVPAGGTAGQLIAKTESGAEWVDGVLSTALTGLSTATNAAIAATDTILSAFGKLAARVNAIWDETDIDRIYIPVGATGVSYRVGRNCTFNYCYIDCLDLAGAADAPTSLTVSVAKGGTNQFTTSAITTAASTYDNTDFNADAGDLITVTVSNTTGVAGGVMVGLRRVRR